jgi:hypothetical protein
MKVLFQDYTFDTASNKIVFNTTDTITLEQILVITNVKANDIIYNFAVPAKGGTLSGNELYLDYDISGMNDTDPLQIFLEIPMNPSTEETAVLLNESVVLLRKLVHLLAPIATQDSQQRQRISLDASTATVNISGTVTANPANGTITTVQAVNNLSNFNTVDAKYLLMDTARNMFANGIRQNLTY